MNCQKAHIVLKKLKTAQTAFDPTQYDPNSSRNVEKAWKQVEVLKKLEKELTPLLNMRIRFELIFPETEQKQSIRIGPKTTLGSFIIGLYTKHNIIDAELYGFIIQQGKTLQLVETSSPTSFAKGTFQALRDIPLHQSDTMRIEVDLAPEIGTVKDVRIKIFKVKQR